MKKAIKVAATQYEVPETSEKMLGKIEKVLKSVKKGTDLVLLPEDCYPTLQDARNDVDSYDNFASLAKKYNLYLSASSMKKDKKGDLREIGFIFDKKGKLIHEQGKMCIPPPQLELGVKPDNTFSTVNTEFGRLAMLICKDSFYRYTNDLFQTYRKAGVDVILIPTWSYKVNQRSISLVREGIIAECNWSDIYICLSGTVKNSITKQDGTVLKSFGHALIVCPLRGVLKEGSEAKEEILYQTLEPKYLKEIREYDKIWQPEERLEFKIK